MNTRLAARCAIDSVAVDIDAQRNRHGVDISPAVCPCHPTLLECQNRWLGVLCDSVADKMAMTRFEFGLLIALTLTFARAADAADPGVSSATDVERVVRPFFKTYCVECHGKSKPEAGLTLERVGADFSDTSHIETWQRVLEQLELGAMPPKTANRPATIQVKRVKGWITQQLRQVNQTPTIEHKRRAPSYGNHTSHERLFDGSQTGPASSPPRLWRLSPFVYDRFINGVGRNLRQHTAIHQPFPLDESKGRIADYAAQHFADSATLELLMMNCRTIAEYQTDGVLYRDHEDRMRRLKRTPPEFQQIIDSQSPPSDEQIRTAIALQFDLLLERAPTPPEMTQLVQFCHKAIAVSGNVRGLQTTLQAVLLKPEAVYRMEIGLGPHDEHGRHRLSRYELAFALARALNDKGPGQIRVRWPTANADDFRPVNPDAAHDGDHSDSRTSLLQLALDGVLDDPDNIRSVVTQILHDNNMSTADYRMFVDDHRIGNTRVLRFFREFFGYHHAPKVFKDAKRIGHGDRYLTERMVDDADQLVMHIFDEDR
ncbi:MAG: c-type cytochrome domain-containing protein, partial [Planctomycetaceae bacterium]